MPRPGRRRSQQGRLDRRPDRRPVEGRVPQLEARGALRCVLGWLHIEHDRWAEAEPLILRGADQILRDCVRPGDLAGRLGGDEFILVLDTADVDVATRRGHEVRDRIRAAPWDEVHPRLAVAASVGVACGEQGETELYRAADEALHEAKRAGGACVRTYRGGRPAIADRDVAGQVAGRVTSIRHPSR